MQSSAFDLHSLLQVSYVPAMIFGGCLSFHAPCFYLSGLRFYLSPHVFIYPACVYIYKARFFIYTPHIFIYTRARVNTVVADGFPTHFTVPSEPPVCERALTASRVRTHRPASAHSQARKCALANARVRGRCCPPVLFVLFRSYVSPIA